MSGSWADAEHAVVRRARLRVSVLVALAITVLVAVVGGIAYTVMTSAQDDQVDRELRYAIQNGAPSAPPRCVWLFSAVGREINLGETPPPMGFPLHDDIRAVQQTGEPVERTVARDGTEYRVRTEALTAGRTAQAVFDTRYQLADRGHLLVALLVTELGGLLAAAVTGLAVGRRALAPLAKALATQRRFVLDASHELRTPIARAHVRAQLLARRAAAAELPGDHREGIRTLAGLIGTLGEVVDDLLLSARFAADPAAVGARDVDLADLARTMVARERDRADERGVELSVSTGEGPVTVTGVATALCRVVGELLANAVRHTPPGGRVDVRVANAGTRVELTVADTGEGFDQEEAGRLFDRFHRGFQDGAAGAEPRFGLGLALVREVVSGHGGTVEATGRPGAGARFTVRLPVSEHVSAPRP